MTHGFNSKVSRDAWGWLQADREANCRARRDKHRLMDSTTQARVLLDGLNYSFQGGFGGIYHRAKKGAADETLPANLRAIYQEARDWGTMAFVLEKKPWFGEVQLTAAVFACALISKATSAIASGWVGDAGLVGSEIARAGRS